MGVCSCVWVNGLRGHPEVVSRSSLDQQMIGQRKSKCVGQKLLPRFPLQFFPFFVLSLETCCFLQPKMQQQQHQQQQDLLLFQQFEDNHHPAVSNPATAEYNKLSSFSTFAKQRNSGSPALALDSFFGDSHSLSSYLGGGSDGAGFKSLTTPFAPSAGSQTLSPPHNSNWNYFNNKNQPLNLLQSTTTAQAAPQQQYLVPPSPPPSTGSPALTSLSSPENKSLLQLSNQQKQHQEQFPSSSFGLLSDFTTIGDSIVFPSTAAVAQSPPKASLFNGNNHYLNSHNLYYTSDYNNNNSNNMNMGNSMSTSAFSNSCYSSSSSLLSYLPSAFTNINNASSSVSATDAASSYSSITTSLPSALLTISPSDISPPDVSIPETPTTTRLVLFSPSCETSFDVERVDEELKQQQQHYIHHQQQQQPQQQQLHEMLLSQPSEDEYDSLFDTSEDEMEEMMATVLTGNSTRRVHGQTRVKKDNNNMMELDEVVEENEENDRESDGDFGASSLNYSSRKRKSVVIRSTFPKVKLPRRSASVAYTTSTNIIATSQQTHVNRSRKTSTASLPASSKVYQYDSGDEGEGDQDEGRSSSNIDEEEEEGEEGELIAELTKNITYIRRGSVKFYICPVDDCRREFSRQFNLRTHLRTHNPHRSRPWICPHPGCNATFVRSHDLERHSVVHNEEKPFTCTGCGVGFTRRDALKRHIEKKGCTLGWEALELSSKRRRKSN